MKTFEQQQEDNVRNMLQKEYEEKSPSLFNADGTQRVPAGDGVHTAFWRGFNMQKNMAVPTSLVDYAWKVGNLQRKLAKK